MGVLLPSYKKAIIDEIVNNISTNTSYYYAFASHPIPYDGDTPLTNSSNYSSVFEPNWNLLFGKKISNSDIIPVIRNVVWTSNTLYSAYDDKLDLSNTNFYVVVSPSIIGQFYHVYKCIQNGNNTPSTQKPDLQQLGTFTTSDGYSWRYMYSISDSDYTKFATTNYVPVTPNSSVQSAAASYSGIESIQIANSGSGYNCYNNGTVRAVVNSTLIQIENSASTDNSFYNNNAIYIFNASPDTAQLKTVTSYISNISGNWVTLDSSANVTNINPGVTSYLIAPRLVFKTDGTTQPTGYVTINTTSNSISGAVIFNNGTGVTRGTVSIGSNTLYGSGANLICVIPPAGGHGSDPSNELYVKGMAIQVKFNTSESNTIPTDVKYNKIGIYKNPKTLQADGTKGGSYTNVTFNQLLVANISPSVTIANNDTVIGQSSGAVGLVVTANSTVIKLAGDKSFTNNETIVSSNGTVTTTLSFTSRGNIYVDDLTPIYYQNIDNVTRSASQSETFKLVIQV